MNEFAGATWLFVPGHRPDRFDKALATGADEVILDLEDAVSPARKPEARDAVARWLRGGGRGWVRINARSDWLGADGNMDAIAETRGLRGVMLPKAEDTAEVTTVARYLSGLPIVALIETARGVDDAVAVAQRGPVTRLAFGSIDYALDIDASEDDEALLFARSALVIASRVAELPAPIDGVTIETRDADRVAAQARRAKKLGFGGKLCIHPAQVSIVAAAFRPHPDEVEWARQVVRVAADESDVATVGAQMIDKPLIMRARRILAQATREG